jgi:hypothetical protein
MFLTSDMNTDENGDYKVDVNPEVAFTITYADDHGRLLFAIEVADDPKVVFLNPKPSTRGRMTDLGDEACKARVTLAVQRVKAYFNALGLVVKVD